MRRFRAMAGVRGQAARRAAAGLARALCVAAACRCLDAPAAAAVPPLWPGAARGTLGGRLDPAAAGTLPPAGIETSWKTVPCPRGEGILLSAEAANRAAEFFPGGAVPVISLTFRLGLPAADAFQALSYRTEEWYGSTFWTGPDWTRVGKDWHHPGENTASVRRFDIPRDGRVRIRGPVRKLHLDGDGIRACILHGGRKVWQADIDGGDGAGVDPDVTLDVRRGDAVRFIVHKRGAIWCDTTGWDPVIAYADGEVFRASEAFGAAQGAGGWSYEMCPNEVPVGAGPPAALVLGRDLVPRRLVPGPGEPAHADAGDSLPIVVLAAEDEASAVCLALDAAAGWRFEAAMPDPLTCTVTFLADIGPLGAGASTPLPACLAAACTGRPDRGLVCLADAAAGAAESGMGTLWRGLGEAVARAAQGMVRPPEPELFLWVLAEWCREDGILARPDRSAPAAREHALRARALLRRLDGAARAPFEARLEALVAALGAAGDDPAAWRRLYLGCRLLKRDIALADAGLGECPILFCLRRPPNYSHLVMQYYGWRQQPGGGLHLLESPGTSLRTREITAGRFPPGSFLEPRLSFDAARVVFSFVALPRDPIDPTRLPVNEEGPDEAYFHLYTMGVDGSDLRQLTAGPYDDVMPTWLPDGGIAFCSTRRRSYSRCFGPAFSRRWDAYTLHRIEADGTGLRQLSWNDVNEWFPEVMETGQLLFARWDYIDRDAVTHQNLWSMRPDGTNQAAVWGNATPAPHCAFQAKPVPGSGKIVFVASAHHSVTGGPLCLLDPAVDSNSLMAALTRLTPQPFPEAEGAINEYYNSPWPLSERLFLAAYSPEPLLFEPARQPDHALGLYLVDAEGNRELLYRSLSLGSTSPVPVRPRPVPPVLPGLRPGQAGEGAEELAEVFLADAYRGLGDVARGTLRELRVLQIFPKTTPLANTPPVGFAGEENARAVLGTVPLLPDGSARFLVPARRPLLFQVLDADGCAYQTMRSTTAFQPGERTSCIGCHENRMTAPPVARPLARDRSPDRLRPGPFDGAPFSYMSVVQPIWDRHCLACHGPEKPAGGINLARTPRDGFAESYWSLCGDPAAFLGSATNPERAAGALVPRFGARNRIEVTPPGGVFGARGSRLLRMLREGHQKVALTPEELRRIATWIDCNAVFYGSYHPEVQARELAGEAAPMPEIQ